MSESLAHQNPQSLFRRAPSTIMGRQYSKIQSAGVAAVPFNMETEDLLKVAKSDIEKLRQKGRRVSSTSSLNILHNACYCTCMYSRYDRTNLLQCTFIHILYVER